ncbi:aconitate hydratase AcnA [Cytobacillus depressus]|uniref:Aconitate hydratase n=1 Tax=Cytobacillus depressus TaxID=1602942 RepID=A0A6L3V9Q9_9BACI|nr:aconitate hydratase AcnA [Cytobacillus depressus]KAB2336107.1 aconitate hydratase AcnA [Cytobacillus depressus]
MDIKTFNMRSKLKINDKDYIYYPIKSLIEQGFEKVNKLPYSLKVLLEAAIRNYDGKTVTKEHIKKIANWTVECSRNEEIPFKPARVLMHDTTGLPALVDLAAMRETISRKGKDASKVNPVIPVDLVIDHSVAVDFYGTANAVTLNEKVNMERNKERFRFLRWAQNTFDNLKIVPPATGIMHQINMEYLSSVVIEKDANGQKILFPDSLVGTDSHTTMINGLGIVAWGVGGLEAEVAIIGQPLYFEVPQVLGFKLTGELAEGVTATDLALTITQMLREYGVVGRFVEFFGPGVQSLSVADRATVSNMAPEYGATMGYFPIDIETIHYLRLIGRSEEYLKLIETYYKEQGMFMDESSQDPDYPEIIELDLSKVTSSLAGPKRPQDRINLTKMKESFNEIIRKPIVDGGYGLTEEQLNKRVTITHENGKKTSIMNGSVVLAAITSCTNTSNPTVLMMAGLLAKNAVEKGLKKPSFVKSSLTPGSRVVTDYLRESGLLFFLEDLGFHIAGYGCATCIGNSGPLPAEVSQVIEQHDLTVASVISGNRNFEGRVHPEIKANYLASPPLVIAYALAGTINIDFATEPIGFNDQGIPVYLREIWPSSAEIQKYLADAIYPELFKGRYQEVYTANEDWNKISIPEGLLYEWDPSSTYIQEPPFLHDMPEKLIHIQEIEQARVLAFLGDSVTTDHLSPSGAITPNSLAGAYLSEMGIDKKDFNSYPSRRGNHHVMVRGALANHRIRNRLVPGLEGGFTEYFPSNEIMPIYEASTKYKEKNIPLIIIAGKEYGTGSSRDWAAKGVYLLGVKAVIAESFERIHRSNLVGMGVLPLQFANGASAQSLGITGREIFRTIGLSDHIKPGETIHIEAIRENGTLFTFEVIVRLDNVVDIEYYQSGGIMQRAARRLIGNQ